MLKLMIGRAGSGKSTAILQTIAQSGGARPQLLIVPEQASHETERRLCSVAGNQASLYAEVLSFTRLGSRVLAQAGGLAAPVLDAGGRLLLMYAALKSVAGYLTVYARPSRKPAFLSGLLATLDECKQYAVRPEDLARTGEELEGREGDKLKDLGLIFGAYEAMTAQTAADPRDQLDRLAEGLHQCRYAQGMDIYVDGFTDFTPQEGMVLKELLGQAESVTVALTGDCADSDAAIFAPSRRTAAYLLRLARGSGTSAETHIISGDHICKVKQLSWLERNLFSDAPEIWPERTGAVRVFSALTPRSEVEWTASEILRLVHKDGYRFRDMAVAARGFDRYGPLVEEVFRRYGIPVFLDSMTDILQKPIFAVVTGALDAVTGDFSYDDVFRYLKTGLAGISRAECDVIENYVLKWGVKGNRWTTKKEWDMHPRGYGLPLTPTDEARLRELNAIRRRIVEPLELLRNKTSKTGVEQAKTLYKYLEEIGLAQRLVEHAERLRQGGELKKAEEYRQLWEILCGGLDQCAELLGETPLELEEFAKLFKLVLSQYEVGAIPVSLDRLHAGEAARLGNREIKALFLLGADDGAIPQAAPAPGLFTDDDRSLLASYGLELAPQLTDKLDRELTIVYEACARPTEKLVVSWSAVGPQGEEQRPSFLQGRLSAFYPGNPVLKEADLSHDFRLSAPGPALELAGRVAAVRTALSAIPEYAPSVTRIVRAAASERGRLSHGSVNALYGRRVPMSASRMDKYKSCHFAYFMQYGLSAKPRRAALFQAPEYGTFVHYVLEHVLQEPERQRDQVRPLVRGIMERYISEELGGLENKTPRFVYLFHRLIRPVVQVVENVLDELQASEFKPVAFELGFGSKGDLPPVTFTADGLTISISGFVDRVDGWVHGDKLYLRVVDYKTGRKVFDLTEVWNGIGLQMLLYLFTLQDKGQDVFGREVVPAGVLYLPAREAVIQGSRAMDDAVRRKRADAELRRHGLVLDDAEVVEAMEAAGEGGIRFLPLKVSAKTGAITGDALVSAARLGKLKQHTERILREIGEELAAGNIAADPYWRGPEKNACRYCDYAAACQFEEGRGGDQKRWLPALDGEAFWSAVEE